MDPRGAYKGPYRGPHCRDWWFPTVRVLFMLVVTLAEGPATAVVVDGYADYWQEKENNRTNPSN